MCRNSIADWLIDPQRAAMNKEKHTKSGNRNFRWQAVNMCRWLLTQFVNPGSKPTSADFRSLESTCLGKLESQSPTKTATTRHRIWPTFPLDSVSYPRRFSHAFGETICVAGLGYVWRATTGVDTYQSAPLQREVFTKYHKTIFSVSRGFLASNRKQ